MKDPSKTEAMLEEIFDCRGLTEGELSQRQKRYSRECEMGYFLQPIYV